MSVALAMNVHDGVILAADSASTLMLGMPVAGPDARQVVNVYNNANKIANLYKGAPIGCVAFGSGSIGNASVSTLLKDFRKRLEERSWSFDPNQYSMEQVAKMLGAFLAEECSRLLEVHPQPTLGIFLGGYSSNAALGERWVLNIENGSAHPPACLHKQEEVGINWGGEGGEAISRIVLGYSAHAPGLLSQLVTTEGAADKLMEALAPQLQAPILFAPMPIQDAIELAEFLVQTAIQFSRFTPGAQVVGGPIEIAAITRHEGFKWIRRKHYYGPDLNKENRT